MRKIYIGTDVGSTGCKSIAIDENGKTVAVKSERYDNSITCVGLGAYDQSTSILSNASLKCLKALIAELGHDDEVDAMGFTGQMHGLVGLDINQKPVRPIISCIDFRNEKQTQELYEKIGGISGLLEYTNNKMVPSCTGGKILWMLENERELFEKIKVIICPKDYVRTVLTGIPCTDESDASGFGLYDTKNHCWNKDLLAKAGIPESVLPPVYSAGSVIGCVKPDIAEMLGIGKNVKVVAGAGDAVMQTVASGAIEDGVYSIILGSGGLIGTTFKNFTYNDEGRLQIYCSALENSWVSYVGLMSVGTSVNWFRKGFYPTESAVSADNAFAVMQNEAASVEPGSGGLLFSSTILGQRNPVEDPFTKGCVVGMSTLSERRHLARALFEGIALGTKEVYELMSGKAKPMDKMIISGGAAVNDLWCGIFADVYQKPVYRFKEYQSCGAYGAATLARFCERSADDLIESLKSPDVDKEFLPNKENASVYTDLYEMYTEIYPRNKLFFKELTAYETKHRQIHGGAV